MWSGVTGGVWGNWDLGLLALVEWGVSAGVLWGSWAWEVGALAGMGGAGWVGGVPGRGVRMGQWRFGHRGLSHKGGLGLWVLPRWGSPLAPNW